ncbi:alpha/beta fold hydrolase [Microbacterium sp.]|jgi:pimeloyl-ACP methyl ester carboxylesterase|uniref:alpha/beta fold hydrolase n=1 Tax=Microbacterium sp. TaxID=51671 RepID=UPI0037C78505
MSDTFDEFSFVAEQAQAAGITKPETAHERLTIRLEDGRSLSALRWGSESPRVTFLHGAGLNAHTWDTTILALGIPALAIDLPGHGDSSWRDDADYRPRTIAPDIAAALEAWTDAPQLLVGQSLGGIVAAAVGAAHPAFVESLVIVDVTPGIDPGEGPAVLREFFSGPTDYATRDELVERAMAFGLGGDRRATERGVYLNTRVRPDGRVEWKHHMARLAATALAPASSEAPAPGAGAPAHEPVLGGRGWDDLAAVRAPLMLIRGTQGYVTPANLEEFERRLPHASVVEVEAGHNVQENIPVELANLVRDRIAD